MSDHLARGRNRDERDQAAEGKYDEELGERVARAVAPENW
jgi:hypothetical protein